MAEATEVRIKRIYDPPEEDDGLRVLVDGLWPRGLKKTDAHIDWWAKELAPTAPLRKWFGHEGSRFGEFRTRYLEELRAKRDIAQGLLQQAGGGPITLLFAARDRACNHAVVLRGYLSEGRSPARPTRQLA